MTPKADNKFKQVLSHQHAYSKESITKQKISGSYSYISRTRYQNPNTHLNEKLQQRHQKVPKGPD